MADPSDQRKMADQNEVIARCERFEAEIMELRAAYEQYFLGLERRPPITRHAELRRHLLELKGMWVRQTAAKFRVQAAAQKYATYDRLWQRTMQEIEAGTYQRDVERAKRKHATTTPVKAEAPAPSPVAAVTPEAIAPPTPPSRSPAPSPPPATKPAASSVLSDDALRGVYEAYVTAKKRCNEDVSKMNFEHMAQTLRRQVPELMKKHNAQGIEFKVVIKDGKAILRAVPKNG